MKQLKKQVETILQEDEQSRNSDIRLMMVVWSKYYPEFITKIKDRQGNIKHYIEFKNLYNVPREDNIKRIRAKFQNEEIPTY